MARFRPNSDLGQVSGALAGSIYRLARNSPVLQRRGRRKTSHSAAALASRARFAPLAAQWRSLTDLQRREWNAAARSFPRTNRLGVRQTRTGWQFFHQIQPYRNILGYTTLSAPTNFNRSLAAALITTVVSDAPEYRLQFTLTGATGPTKVLAYSTTLRRSSGVPTWSRWAYMRPAGAITLIQFITASFTAQFGELRPGMTVRHRWISLSETGIPSMPQERQATVQHV